MHAGSETPVSSAAIVDGCTIRVPHPQTVRHSNVLSPRQLLTVIQLPVNDHVVLENGPVAGESQLRSLNDTFTPISVPNPLTTTDSVDIRVNEGTTLLINGLDDAFNGDLDIYGNTGSVVRVEGDDIDVDTGAIQVLVGRIEVASSLSADGQIELFTTDLGSPLQDVVIESGAIHSRSSGISIEASDDLRLASAASLTAAESIEIWLDSVNHYAVGSHAHLMGAMHAGSGIAITGGDGDDIIHAGAQHADLQIHGGAGSGDLVTAGGNGFSVGADQVMDSYDEIDDSLTLSLEQAFAASRRRLNALGRLPAGAGEHQGAEHDHAAHQH